jgi:SAM-dependent methyltransferase
MEAKKLNIGSSVVHLTGWLNMDHDKEYWDGAEKGAVGWGEPFDGFDSVIATRDKPDDFGNATKLHYADNTFEEVRSSHVMEHIPCTLINKAISEQFRVLKPGGKIRVIVPSLEILIERYNDKKKYRHFWDATKNDPGLYLDSELKKPYDTDDEAFSAILYLNGNHLNAFTTESLTSILRRAGFINISNCDDEEIGIPDGTLTDYSLRLKGYKPL